MHADVLICLNYAAGSSVCRQHTAHLLVLVLPVAGLTRFNVAVCLCQRACTVECRLASCFCFVNWTLLLFLSDCEYIYINGRTRDGCLFVLPGIAILGHRIYIASSEDSYIADLL
jgi:hypothetical protein